MVGTAEYFGVTRAPNQPLPAMLTGVVERPDGAVVLHNAEHRLVQKVMDDVVTRFSQLADTAGDVPDASPEPVPFFLGELPRVVALAVHRIAAQIGWIRSVS